MAGLGRDAFGFAAFGDLYTGERYEVFQVRGEAGTVKAFVLAGLAMAGMMQAQQVVNLATSKQLIGTAPGDPRRVNSLPAVLALSPDGRWVVSLNMGYGTFESNYEQSLAVMDTKTGEIKDFPDVRIGQRATQTFFSGLAFSADGTKVYASLASSVDATGDGKEKTGNGVVVYSFAAGVLKPSGFLKLPLVKLGEGRHTDYRDADGGTMGYPYPAAIAVVPGARERLLVAENLSDSVALMDAATGKIERSFDVSENDAVPSVYPIAVAVTKDGKRGFVALWNASEVVELDLATGKVVRKVELLKPKLATAPGTHPCALLLDEKSGLMYVALSNRDAVAAVEIGKSAAPELEVKGYFDTRLPGQTYFGAEPDALALNAAGTRLYAANMGSDAVAVLDPHRLKTMEKGKGMTEPMGFVPTELMPMGLVVSGGKLFVATGKGKGIGPNNMPQRVAPTGNSPRGAFTYVGTLEYGSLAAIDETALENGLKQSTEVVLASNRMKAEAEKIEFDAEVIRAAGLSATSAKSADSGRDEKVGGGFGRDEKGMAWSGPIKHVIYIIKENRTYDQVFGDLTVDGKKVGNGDPSLTMYGAAITPNEHKLALQFGVLDNFFDSGEVSGEGHVWSTAAIGTDYLEKTWQLNYRGRSRTYDYEGMVADGYPLLQHIPDVDEPASSYIWTDMAAHGKTVYHFGEYVSSTYCGDKKSPKRIGDPKQGGAAVTEVVCASPSILPGEAMPAEWGGGKNLWGWAIPRLSGNTATKPELVGHFAPEAPDFNLRIPDQVRVNVFLQHLEQWKRDRAAGKDTMPNYILLRLGNDHTGGTSPGGPTPKSSVADNDLAVGRAVEAVSHSAYWDDTAFFILEDDAQNGADHVDAHRSLGIVVSKYAPHPKAGEGAFVDSRFYSTVSVLRTMEALLGVPPMNNNDAFASMISTLFTGPGDQAAYTADVSNRENGLIYTANKKGAPGAAMSMKMDFTHADRADTDKLNLILWQDAMGSQPPPPMLLGKHKKKKDADDE
jgi:DNA-binding beta-propeller fold protein YncE